MMNGAAERLGRTLWRKAKPMLKHAGLDFKYWPEAVKRPAYLYQRSPHSAIRSTPFEAWTQCKPDLRHIRRFGSIAYYTQGKKKKKLDEDATKGILVGVWTMISSMPEATTSSAHK
jgi:hypothetical protein